MGSSQGKNNLRKHGIRFADAATALEDESAISIRDERHDEERWVTIGMDSLARILVVATQTERSQYEDGYEKGI